MPDFGSEEYIWEIVNNFIGGAVAGTGQTGFGGGIMGSDLIGFDWWGGYMPDQDYITINQYEDVGNSDIFPGGTNQFIFPSSIYENELAGVSPLQVDNYFAGSYFTPTVFNMSDWVQDWGLYLPTFNPEDITNLTNKAAFEKRESTWDILSKARDAENKLYDRALQGSNTYSDFLYNSALATGRLSDFKASADVQGLQNQFDADLYGAIGDIAGLGAFDWSDEWNVDYMQTMIQDDTMPLCDQECEAACQDFVNYNPEINLGGIEAAQAQCQDCLNACIGV